MVWSDDVLLHVPSAEIWVGVRTPGTEVAERATLIREACLAAGAPELGSMRHDDEVLAALHDPGLLNHLEHVYDDWTASGIPERSARTGSCRTSSPYPGSWAACRCASPRPCTAGPGAGATTR